MAAAVRFEHVTKRYLRGGPRYPSLRTELRTALARRRRGTAEPTGKLALSDVTFDVDEGDSFAVIGPNGAGKTTLLKLVSRISYPTGGRITVRGRVGALIEVGSGVHPELTARENIWLYGQILGMSKADIRRRFDEIVEFAEIADALDTPVKMYSSGMQLRLGFSVASHLDPAVFVVDEALAVGDVRFQSRCVERMTKLTREGRTLVFVSHNLAAVETLCQQAALLDHGQLVDVGPVRSILARYLSSVQHRSTTTDVDHDDTDMWVERATIHDKHGQERYEFEANEPLELRLVFGARRPIDRPHVNIGFTDGRPGLLVQCSMLTDGQAPDRVDRHWECRCAIAGLPLRPRMYYVFVDVYGAEGHSVHVPWAEVSSIRIVGDDGSGPMAVVNAALAGAVDVPYTWTVLS